MSNSFLEREKELMKLNETLNNKMTFDLKTPKAIHLKSTNKSKRVAVNKALKCDGTKGQNKLKNDSSDVIQPVPSTHTTEKFSDKHELDSKDAAFNSNYNIDDVTHKSCNEIKRPPNEEQTSNEKTSHGSIETAETTIDMKPSPNATHLSLIPPNMFRKNASSEGIIK